MQLRNFFPAPFPGRSATGLWLGVLLQLISLAVCRDCYRCMSRYYGTVWDYLGYHRIYQKPTSKDLSGFTDACANPEKSPRAVPTEHCENFSNCISIREKIEAGMGNVGYIRGCYDTIFRWGFNRTGDSGRLQYREFCKEFNSTELVRSERPARTLMYVCSCRSSLCNGANESGGIEGHRNLLNTSKWLRTMMLVMALMATVMP